MNEIIIWTICVVQWLQMIEYLFDINYIRRWTNPQFLLWVFEASSLDVPYLIYSEVSLLTPLQLFIKKI